MPVVRRWSRQNRRCNGVPKRDWRAISPEAGIAWRLNERILKFVRVRWRMLLGMQPSAQSPFSPAPPNFAGILAAIASPTVDNPELAKAWAENELGDDVVTLSYERALSQHARYKPQPFPDRGDVPSDWRPEPAARVDE